MITLVLGGTRSGKSAVAERLVASGLSAAQTEVTYVATGVSPDSSYSDGLSDSDGPPDGDGWAARIAVHRARRPPQWSTIEVPLAGDLPSLLYELPPDPPVLVDSIGTWLAGFDRFEVEVDLLCDALEARGKAGGIIVVVSEEVGLGVHPPTESGRQFADALGTLNQAVAKVADRVVLVVAGRLLELDSGPAPGPTSPSPSTSGA
jgi:adenosylcobinamide kinase/adenosylcobinamide-phosphate guanylyltransferase